MVTALFIPKTAPTAHPIASAGTRAAPKVSPVTTAKDTRLANIVNPKSKPCRKPLTPDLTAPVRLYF